MMRARAGELANQLLFLAANPVTPPCARRRLIVWLFDGQPAWVPDWFMRRFGPALMGLGVGSMPHRVQ